jgi:heme/copper-type cytochrome/quinol oxidase subunit 4
MAASKTQGSYLAVFWTAITVLCAGLAYFAEGFGKLVLLFGLVGVIISLVGFLKIKPLEGRTAGPATIASLKILGIAVALGGWFVTVAGLHITTSVGGRMIFALVGIAVSLVGVLGVLPVAFGRSLAGKAQSSSFIAAKTTMEHSR